MLARFKEMLRNLRIRAVAQAQGSSQERQSPGLGVQDVAPVGEDLGPEGSRLQVGWS